jgi:hypothetical protein
VDARSRSHDVAILFCADLLLGGWFQAQVMLVKNLNVKRGLTNGSRGIVASFTKAELPVVKFVSGLTEVIHKESWVVGVGSGE